MAVEIHHRVGDLLRAVPRIEIEHLVVLAAAVLAIGPKPKQDIGLLAGHMILEEFGRASAIEDGAVQEVAAFGFDASSCACALPAKVSYARLRAVRRTAAHTRKLRITWLGLVYWHRNAVDRRRLLNSLAVGMLAPSFLSAIHRSHSAANDFSSPNALKSLGSPRVYCIYVAKTARSAASSSAPSCDGTDGRRVLANSVVVGRSMKAAAARVGARSLWTQGKVFTRSFARRLADHP